MPTSASERPSAAMISVPLGKSETIFMYLQRRDFTIPFIGQSMRGYMLHASQRTMLLGLALTVAGVAPTSTWAQGFGLNEIGTCAEARGFANTGAPCHDASSIYWNPAATTSLPGFSVYAGASGIRINGAFRQDTTNHKYNSNVPWVVPPAAFVNYSNMIGPNKFAIGFGEYVPYGLISQWRDDFPGRFAAQRASINSIYLQPNFAIEIIPSVLSIGGGPVIGIS